MPGLDQLGERERERGLEAEHPRGRLLEHALLALGRVGRVVGGDGVDGAVGEAVPDGGDVTVGAQGRVHLEHGVEARALGVGEREVMGRGLARDRQPAGLGRAHEVDGLRRAHVEEVHARAGQRAELDVARHDDGLRGRRPSGDAEP